MDCNFENCKQVEMHVIKTFYIFLTRFKQVMNCLALRCADTIIAYC